MYYCKDIITLRIRYTARYNNLILPDILLNIHHVEKRFQINLYEMHSKEFSIYIFVIFSFYHLISLKKIECASVIGLGMH
jgi:hypothetical protein